jgi:hypothetical protein
MPLAAQVVAEAVLGVEQVLLETQTRGVVAVLQQ